MSSPDKTQARASIAKCRKKVVPERIAKLLEGDFSEPESRDTIDSLKRGKKPGLDGLTNEFFQVYKDFLVGHHLFVLKESLSFGALPFSINDGVIKLIHKERRNTS